MDLSHTSHNCKGDHKSACSKAGKSYIWTGKFHKSSLEFIQGEESGALSWKQYQIVKHLKDIFVYLRVFTNQVQRKISRNRKVEESEKGIW